MVEKKIIDPTGAELRPGDPENCQGNGKDPAFECCCDECDYLAVCAEVWEEQERRREAWDFAHGLSDVDELNTSAEMKELIEREIAGEISTADIKRRLDEKYATLAKEER